ncbi:SGNH/GDSL hydrolase family protein [Alkalihalophilus marmarensis]|uniref:SGNH/GDSL hydrolase family protein n=1 Tax=Alkalihalophilus marmarensis TaxID=521377 RepID=UPI002E1C1806|nr:SGNH/GDSL hydrolase family protein [Alkalihalophilus marmarensis]
MKYILFFSTLAACGIILIFSYSTYQEKLQEISSNAQESFATPQSTTNSVTPPNNQNEEENTEIATEGLLDEIIKKTSSEDPATITFFGSISLINEQNESESWPTLVMEEVTSNPKYSSIASTTIHTGRLTSLEVIQDEYIQEVVASKPDLLFFEPFILNNNGLILIEDTKESIEIMLNELKVELPETEIILLPPNPLYNTVFYIEQVKELQALADQNNLLYADHWKAWPPTDDEDLQNYLEDGRPNDKGHSTWAEYIVQFLYSNH